MLEGERSYCRLKEVGPLYFSALLGNFELIVFRATDFNFWYYFQDSISMVKDGYYALVESF